MRCDVCFMANFSCPIQSWLDDHQERFTLLSGRGQVKKGLISKFIFLHKRGISLMQLITGNLMVVLVSLYVVNDSYQLSLNV